MYKLPKTGYYVYTLARPVASIFYVGKGCGDRVKDHEWEAKRGCDCHKCRVIRKVWRAGHQVEKRIIFITQDETEAYEQEKKVIAKIGLARLTNIEPGGSHGTPQEFYYPDKPLLEVTSGEHAAYLWNIRGMTQANHKVEMENWQHRKLNFIESKLTRLEWRRARGYDVAEQISDLEEIMSRIYNELRSEKQVKMPL